MFRPVAARIILALISPTIMWMTGTAQAQCALPPQGGGVFPPLAASASPSPITSAHGTEIIQFNPIYDVNVDFGTQGQQCWVATASNAIGATGWGVGTNGTRPATARTIFNQLSPLFPNAPGYVASALMSYFDLHQTDWGYPADASWLDWFDRYIVELPGPTENRLSSALGAIRGLLGTGYAVGASVNLDPALPGGSGHAINVFGYEQDGTGAVTRLVITDNGDTLTGPQTVSLSQDSAGGVYLNNYTRPAPITSGSPTQVVNGIPLYSLIGLQQEHPVLDMTIKEGRPAAATDVPIVLGELVNYLNSFYGAPIKETGITDAPLVGFNGHGLAAAETGQNGLRYTPGPAIGDQIIGNGIDELVPISFSFPGLTSVASAKLILDLTPMSSLVANDLLLIADNNSTSEMNIGNAFFRTLSVGEEAQVTFDLSAIPSSLGPLNLLSDLTDGSFSFVYGDDAIMHSAELDIVGTVSAPDATVVIPAVLWFIWRKVRAPKARIRTKLRLRPDSNVVSESASSDDLGQIRV